LSRNAGSTLVTSSWARRLADQDAVLLLRRLVNQALGHSGLVNTRRILGGASSSSVAERSAVRTRIRGVNGNPFFASVARTGVLSGVRVSL